MNRAACLLIPLMAGCLDAAEDAPRRAPDLVLADVDGQTFALHAWSGQKVLLEIFGVHCGSCRSMMPVLKGFYDDVAGPGGARMVSIDAGGSFDGLGAASTDEVKGWRAEFQANWTFVHNANGSVLRDYPLEGRPTIYLIAPNGYIQFADGGYQSLDQLKDRAGRLWGQRP